MTTTPEPADTRCVHLRDGGCCVGPGYCAHACDPRTDPGAPATTPEPVTRYLCPMPNCGWTHDTIPADDPLAAERAARLHVDDHSIMEYLRALNAERAAHDAHRTAVSGALGLGTGAPWDAITDRARQVTADLDAARAGDAPWIRAYREDLEDAKKHAKEAEEGERRAMRQRQEMAEERYALQQRADLADRVKRTAAKDAAYALKRAEQAEAAIARVRDAVVQWRGWNPTENAWAIRDIEHALSGDPDPRPQDPPHDGEQPAAGPERCFVCGAPAVINQVVDRRYLCGDCFLCRCGESPCVRTGVNDPAVSAEPEKPCFHPSWETTVGARKCTDCGEWLDPQPEPATDGLYLRLCRMLGAPADTPDDDLIETVRGLLVRDARRGQAPAHTEPEACCGDPNPHGGHRYMRGTNVNTCPGKTRDEPEQPTVPVLDALVTDLFAAVRRAWHRTR